MRENTYIYWNWTLLNQTAASVNCVFDAAASGQFSRLSCPSLQRKLEVRDTSEWNPLFWRLHRFHITSPKHNSIFTLLLGSNGASRAAYEFLYDFILIILYFRRARLVCIGSLRQSTQVWGEPKGSKHIPFMANKVKEIFFLVKSIEEKRREANNKMLRSEYLPNCSRSIARDSMMK